MTTKTTVEILREAKAVIERNGWNRGDYYDTDLNRDAGTPAAQCPVCLLGALRVAVNGHPKKSAGTDEAVNLLLITLDDRDWYSGIPVWQDRPKRTVEDVFALLDAAIERAEGGVSE